MCSNLLSTATNFNNTKILKAALDLSSKTLKFLLMAMQSTSLLISLNCPLPPGRDPARFSSWKHSIVPDTQQTVPCGRCRTDIPRDGTPVRRRFKPGWPAGLQGVSPNQLGERPFSNWHPHQKLLFQIKKRKENKLSTKLEMALPQEIKHVFQQLLPVTQWRNNSNTRFLLPGRLLPESHKCCLGTGTSPDIIQAGQALKLRYCKV